MVHCKSSDRYQRTGTQRNSAVPFPADSHDARLPGLQRKRNTPAKGLQHRQRTHQPVHTVKNFTGLTSRKNFPRPATRNFSLSKEASTCSLIKNFTVNRISEKVWRLCHSIESCRSAASDDQTFRSLVEVG